MNAPSMIPAAGRALRPDEYAALNADMAEIVTRSHLFKSLDDAGRGELIQLGYVTSYSAGDVILRQGDHSTSMYLVLTGTVRVETDSPGGRVHLSDLARGACFGEVSLLTSSERTATVTALTDVDCVCFEQHRIERILDQYPRVRQILSAIVEGRARDTVEKIIGS